MMNIDELKYSVKNLVHRRLRSFLSVLSILIGIASIFALVSFGLGMQDYITRIGQEAGTDKLYIQSKGVGVPGLDETFYFTKNELDFIGKIKGVNEIVGLKMKTPEIEFKNQKKYNFVAGLDPKNLDFIEETMTIKVEKGRRLKNGDLSKVVLGYNYQIDNKIFKKGVSLGDKISLNSKQFEVIGFYEEIGNPSDDANVYLTNDALDLLYPASKSKYAYAMMRSDPEVDPKALAEKITDKFRKYKGQDEGKEDFFVMTFTDALEVFSSILGVINGILVLIALISLVVAAVNIMNTMYTAVLERTREIGVMKAVGAKNSNILLVFVFESGLLGTIGGIIGIILGYVIAKIGGYAITSAGYGFLQPFFPWYLIAGCMFFAFSVGAISGFLPALQASRLKPVDALRYE